MSRGDLIVPIHHDLRSEGSPRDRVMRNKFRLPLCRCVFTYSFQNYGSLHLVQAAASKKPAQIQTVDFSTASCSHGSWSFTSNLCPVLKIKTKFWVSPNFSVRSYCLIRPLFLSNLGLHLLFGMPFSLMKRGGFFPPPSRMYCLWNAHFMPVPVTNW